ncbi:unnamed protein product [Caenorhabditis angaria]|uniref:Serpin domain-containing protein n=1 Tax=Caenorhabditis angaria TaxID=860376 RepID=A0A9P1IUC1_9PELO|nr:unnamed protein product [Caenorhabditis angaria]
MSQISPLPPDILQTEANFGLKILNDFGYEQSSIVSPLSILLSLSLVHLGAKGHTKDQIRNSILNSTHEQFIEHFSGLNKLIDNDINDVQCNIANRLFVGRDQEIEEYYLRDVGKYYNAYAEKVDFGIPSEAATVINKFINETTKGKIDDMVKANNLNGVDAMLVNAIYFEADWRHKFQKDAAKPADFHSSSTKKRSEQFLSDSYYERKYASDDYFQMVLIQYKDKSANLAIFMPKKRFGLRDAMKKMDGKRFHDLIEKAVLEYVFLSFPKFKIEKQISLNTVLGNLGLREIFTESADFSGISPGLKLSAAAHEAMIEVDEWGTRAAAASEVKIYGVSAPAGVPIEFKADQPFLYAVIKDKVPVFMGIYT